MTNTETLSALQINTKIRDSIVQRLPAAIETAMKSYMRFTNIGWTEQKKHGSSGNTDDKALVYEAKDFKAHHDSCKAALAHINMLLDLAKDLLSAMENDDSHIAAVEALSLAVQKAQNEIDHRGGESI